MPHDNLKTVYVYPGDHEELRRLAYEARISMTAVVHMLLLMRRDHRTPEQRERDYFATEGLDTQESDRP